MSDLDEIRRKRMAELEARESCCTRSNATTSTTTNATARSTRS